MTHLDCECDKSIYRREYFFHTFAVAIFCSSSRRARPSSSTPFALCSFYCSGVCERSMFSIMFHKCIRFGSIFLNVSFAFLACNTCLVLFCVHLPISRCSINVLGVVWRFPRILPRRVGECVFVMNRRYKFSLRSNLIAYVWGQTMSTEPHNRTPNASNNNKQLHIRFNFTAKQTF